MPPVSRRGGALLVIVVAIVFFGSWWNRYVPPTAGGEAVLMMPRAGGFLPYRDYFLQAPPGMHMLVGAVQWIAGPHVLATQTFGVLLRVAAACALYALLLTIARPSFAALAALVALFVSCTDISDTPFYYNHVGAALLLCGTYLGVAGSRGARPLRHLETIACGAMLVFAIAIKQTMVFGTAGAGLTLLLFAAPRPAMGWIAYLLELASGAVAAAAAIWAWLAWHHLVPLFLLIMHRAPEGKGGVGRSLLRPMSLLFHVPLTALPTIAAWIALALIVLLWMQHRRGARFGREVLIVLLVILPAWSIVVSRNARLVTLFLTAVGWWGSLVVAAMHLPAVRHDARSRSYLALALLSCSIGYSFAVSWPLFENIAFPALAFVFAALLEEPPSTRVRPWRTAVVFVAIASLGLSVYRKFERPQSWGLWVEPSLLTERGSFTDTALWGMRMSEPASTLYAAVAKIAREQTRPDDRMYVYPNMPILYAVANREPATYALAHWVDVCPDFLGKEDASRLRANPPKLMIIHDVPMDFIADVEDLYLGGARSSVRDVVQAVNDLLPMYEKVAVVRSDAASAISFYVRRDAAAGGLTRRSE